MSTRHIILGLLAREAMTGYDIKSLFKELSWLIDAPSYGSLYPTLHTLLEEGLVTVTVEPGQGKPPRKLYRITETGGQALEQWLRSPERSEISIKAFARHLLLADCLSQEELATHLTRRRVQLEAYLKGTESTPTQGEPETGTLGHRLIHDYGTTVARAELTWLDARLAEVKTSATRVP